MGIRQFAREFSVFLLGVFLAALGLGLLFLEYKEGPAHAHTTHIFIYVAIFGIGMLIIAPSVITGAANKMVMLVLDAKKGGARWTDPPADPPAKKDDDGGKG